MGLRVHKFLGYGLADVATENGQLADPRINADSWLVGYDGEPSHEDYAAWLQANGSAFSMDLACLRFPGSEKPPELRHCCEWRGSDGGVPNVLILRPVACRDWARFDDSIDYVQETWLAPESQGNRVDLIPGGIYPYSGSYMDARTGEKFPDDVLWWVRLRNSRMPDGPDRTAMLDRLAQALGLASHAEAKQVVVPLVPEEIRDLARFAGLFTSDDAWLQLRPLLYTFWA